MLVSEIITLARHQIIDTDGTFLTDTIAASLTNKFLRLVYRKLSQLDSDLIRQSYSQALTGGTAGYTLPTSFWRWQFLRIDGETMDLAQKPWVFMERFTDAVDSGTGTPLYYCNHSDGKVYLRPAPTGGTAVGAYFKSPTALVAADTFPFNGLFDDACANYLVGMLKLADDYDVSVEFALADDAIDRALGIDVHSKAGVLRAGCPKHDYMVQTEYHRT